MRWCFAIAQKEFGDRTLSVFSAVGLAALTFNAELAYAAASESGLVIEGELFMCMRIGRSAVGHYLSCLCACE